MGHDGYGMGTGWREPDCRFQLQACRAFGVSFLFLTGTWKSYGLLAGVELHGIAL
jgi:hypothetical protein